MQRENVNNIKPVDFRLPGEQVSNKIIIIITFRPRLFVSFFSFLIFYLHLRSSLVRRKYRTLKNYMKRNLPSNDQEKIGTDPNEKIINHQNVSKCHKINAVKRVS